MNGGTMSDFTTRLAAAKAAAPRHDDVEVLIDGDLASLREELTVKVAAARATSADDPRLTAPPPEDAAALEAQLNELLDASEDAIVRLRFTRMPGKDWSEIISRCPPRPDAPMDRHYGYNITAATVLAAPLCGARVVGYGTDSEHTVPLAVRPAQQDEPAVDEWADLFSVIAGSEMTLIVDAVYALNEYDPTRRAAQLKKVLATRPA
jgi:hypothetical protein